MYSIGPDPAVNEGNLMKGFAIAGAINIGAAIVGVLTIDVGIGAVIVFGIGVVQALWIGPLYGVYRSKRETETAKGILLAAGYTFLLNAGCWGYVMFPRS
jgi:hypothetical protein